jgi:hypothetical protein|nr:hypothetical protein [Oryza rufipogon]ATA66825.1 hypothetical protein [Oryza sativa Indica Group]
MISKAERLFCRLCGKLVYHADKLCSIMHDDPIIILLILLILVFVSRMLVRALWPRSAVLTSRIFTTFVVLSSAVLSGSVAHAADNEPINNGAAPAAYGSGAEGPSNSALFTYTSDLAEDSVSSGRSRSTASSSFQESTGEMDALMASTTPSAPRTPSGGEPSVNQPLPGEQAMPPALPVMQEAANRALPYAPYPYPVDEIIGGDCVQSIQRRILGANLNPSAHDMQMSRIQAEDLFELKVQIIRKMATLHPSGDWMGWGARALDNPRTATGEEDLAKLHKMLDDLQSRNEQSATFWRLVERVRLRADEDQNSAS